MRIETDEPAREMHRMSGSSWRAVTKGGEKLRGNPAPRSRVMMTWVGLGILMYTYHHLCLNLIHIPHNKVSNMVRKTVEVDDELWKKMEEKAVQKFGLHGAIKKAIKEALEEWLK